MQSKQNDTVNIIPMQSWLITQLSYFQSGRNMFGLFKSPVEMKLRFISFL
jgi:hypothetical protein